MNDGVILRKLNPTDCQLISDAFMAQGWSDKMPSLYEHYLNKQDTGAFDIIIAEKDGGFVDYVIICWVSDFIDFQEQKIPEIKDFNVLKKFQGKGIGTILMDEAERRIRLRSSRAGIAFGAMKDYRPAQVLYIRRGYIPWGNGLTVSGRELEFGESVVVDHSLIFHLSKRLDSKP